MSEIDVGKEIVQALVNRISHLELLVRRYKEDLERAEKKAAQWQESYYQIKKIGHAKEEKLDDAIAKLYAVLGIEEAP